MVKMTLSEPGGGRAEGEMPCGRVDAVEKFVVVAKKA